MKTINMTMSFVGGLMLLHCGQCLAGPELQVWIDNGAGYSNYLSAGNSLPFELVVTLDSDGMDVAGADFAFDVSVPGVLRIGTTYPAGATTNNASEAEGVYSLEFGGCASSCERREIVRVMYYDPAYLIPYETIVTVHGLGGQQSVPTVLACDGARHDAPMGGTPSEPLCSGSLGPSGAAVLAADAPECRCWAGPCFFLDASYGDCGVVVPVEARSFTALKARF